MPDMLGGKAGVGHLASVRYLCSHATPLSATCSAHERPRLAWVLMGR